MLSKNAEIGISLVIPEMSAEVSLLIPSYLPSYARAVMLLVDSDEKMRLGSVRFTA